MRCRTHALYLSYVRARRWMRRKGLILNRDIPRSNGGDVCWRGSDILLPQLVHNPQQLSSLGIALAFGYGCVRVVYPELYAWAAFFFAVATGNWVRTATLRERSAASHHYSEDLCAPSFTVSMTRVLFRNVHSGGLALVVCRLCLAGPLLLSKRLRELAVHGGARQAHAVRARRPKSARRAGARCRAGRCRLLLGSPPRSVGELEGARRRARHVCRHAGGAAVA